MHKQDNTNRDKGLESIMESMYTAAALEPLSEKTVTCDKCNGEGCDHCDNTGNHTVEEAPGNSLDDTGRIPPGVDSFGTGTIGTDADGAELEQGHIVQYDPTGAHQSDPEVSDAQWIVSAAAVAGPDNEAMVDIIQLGKAISVPANHLLVQGELGE